MCTTVILLYSFVSYDDRMYANIQIILTSQCLSRLFVLFIPIQWALTQLKHIIMLTNLKKRQCLRAHQGKTFPQHGAPKFRQQGSWSSSTPVVFFDMWDSVENSHPVHVILFYDFFCVVAPASSVQIFHFQIDHAGIEVHVWESWCGLQLPSPQSTGNKWS